MGILNTLQEMLRFNYFWEVELNMELDGGEWLFCIYSAASVESYSLTFLPHKTSQLAQAVRDTDFLALVYHM